MRQAHTQVDAWAQASAWASQATTSDTSTPYRTLAQIKADGRLSEADRLANLAQRSAERVRMARTGDGPAPWRGMHGGRRADASTSVDAYMAETAIYAPAGMPDGASKADRVPSGWSSAWARQNSTRAGKSERRSVYVGSDKGAPRGQTIDTKQLYKGII